MQYIVTLIAVLANLLAFAQDSLTVQNSRYAVGDTIGPLEIHLPFSWRTYDDYPEEFKAPIDSIANIMKKNPTMHLEIVQHTDSRGSAEKNNERSLTQAGAIRQLLIREGIDEIRLTTVGRGESFPLKQEEYINQFRKTDRETFEMLHQLNRRTEFVITKL